MSNDIVMDLEFEMTIEDQIDHAALDRRMNAELFGKGNVGRPILVVGCLALAVSLAVFIATSRWTDEPLDRTAFSVLLLIALSCGAMAILGLRPRSESGFKKSLRRQLASQLNAGTLKCALGPTIMKIDPTGVDWHVGFSTTHFAWEGVERLDTDDRVIRFCGRQGGIIFIPNRAMNPQQREQILKLAAERITPAAAR